MSTSTKKHTGSKKKKTPKTSGKRLGSLGRTYASSTYSNIHRTDIRKIPKDHTNRNGHIDSCERMFRKGHTPTYTYEDKDKDLTEIARALIKDPRIGMSQKRWLAKGLWEEKGIALSTPKYEHPSNETIKKVQSVEAGLDSFLFLCEFKLVKRRERFKGQLVAAIPLDVRRGTYGDTYASWMEAFHAAGVIRTVRYGMPDKDSPSGDGVCNAYALNRHASSDHSRTHKNPFTQSQQVQLEAGVAREKPSPLVVKCCQWAAEEAVFPPPEAEDEYKGDEGQKRILELLNKNPEKELRPFKDVYKARHHNPFTRLRKELRLRTDFSGHYSVSVDLKSCFPRALASGDLNEWFRKVLGQKFLPDARLQGEVHAGDPYKPLVTENRSRDTVKKYFSEALHAPVDKDKRALGIIGEAYPDIARAIRTVKVKVGNHNFIKQIQAIEKKWMRSFLRTCELKGIPALPVYDEVLIPEWGVPDVRDFANLGWMKFDFEGRGPNASNGGRYNPSWYPEDKRFDPNKDDKH